MRRLHYFLWPHEIELTAQARRSCAATIGWFVMRRRGLSLAQCMRDSARVKPISPCSTRVITAPKVALVTLTPSARCELLDSDVAAASSLGRDCTEQSSWHLFARRQ